MIELPDYKPLPTELQIATRKDGVQVIAIASSRMGVVVRLQSQRGKPFRGELLLMLDQLVNCTPYGNLRWNPDNMQKIKEYL